MSASQKARCFTHVPGRLAGEKLSFALQEWIHHARAAEKPGLRRVAARQTQSEHSCHILASYEYYQAMLTSHRPADRFREDLEQRQVPELELGKSLSCEQRQSKG